MNAKQSHSLPMKRDQAPCFWWYVLVVLLSFEILIYFDEDITFSLTPVVFVPLLAGALAWRYGVRVLGILLLIAFLSALGILIHLTDQVVFYFGQSWTIFLLATAAAVAFCRPAPLKNISGLMHRRWKTIRWLVPIALWLTVFRSGGPEWELSRALTLQSFPALVALLGLLAASVNWTELRTRLHPSLEALSITRAQWFVVLGIVVLLTLPVGIKLELGNYGELSTGFAVRGALGLLIALGFVLPAFKLVDWRLMIVLLVMAFSINPTVTWIEKSFEAAFPAPPAPAHDDSAKIKTIESLLEEIHVTGARIAPTTNGFVRIQPGALFAICASLLAAAIAPFWRSRNPDSLQRKRTGMLLLLIVLLFFSGFPIGSSGLGWAGSGLLGGLAYLAGLQWRIRGVIAAPLVILFSYLLGLTASGNDREWNAAFQMVSIGLIVYPFAFFGLLSNRMVGKEQEMELIQPNGDPARDS